MRHLTLFWITVFSATAPLALTARAQTYQWVDEHGVSVYSNELPPQTTEIRDLAVVEGTGAVSLLERRTLQIINEELRARRAETRSTAEAALPVATPGGDVAAEPPNGILAPNMASENTRDPCLLSWDPKCSEKHARDYHPGWGYAPSIRRSGAESATSPPSAAAVPAPTPVRDDASAYRSNPASHE